MNKHDKNQKDEFYRGQYGALVKLWEADPSLKKCAPAAIIGALSFSGRVQEAVDLFTTIKVDTDESIECRFYLSIGLTRISKYLEARKYLAANLKLLNKSRSPQSQFFIFQGVAFYRYINGRFAMAQKYGDRAVRSANDSNFVYGRALGNDLLGHCRVRTGQITLGLKGLKSALTYAKALGDGGLVSAFTISIATYQAKYQSDAKQAIRLLTKTLREMKTEDNYSRTSISIELSEVYLNAGRCDLARKELNEAARGAIAAQNYRQEVMINLKFAKLYFLANKFSQSLVSLNLCRRICDSRVDKPLILEILALEAEILKATGQTEKLSTVEIDVEKIMAMSGGYLGNGLTQMYLSKLGREIRKGEDIIGDLLDDLKSDSAAQEILESGYLGLLQHCLAIERGRPCLYLNVIPGALTIFSDGQVHHVAQGLSATLIKIIRAINDARVANKEQLISSVWGYQYHPLTHDPLIFTAMARLRSLLGEHKGLLQLTEEGYSFASDLVITEHRLTKKPASTTTVLTLMTTGRGQIDQLNIRQLQIINYLNSNEFIDIQLGQKLFKVSAITASRDLSDLHRRGVISRIGKGRATKYILLRLS